MSDTNQITLGAYEQRVLLELDNLLTWVEVSWVKAKDLNFNITFEAIEFCYVEQIEPVGCVNLILSAYKLPLHKCALEGVAVLSNN